MISVRKKAGLTHESTYGSLFVSERASNTHRLLLGRVHRHFDRLSAPQFSDREHCQQYGRDNGIVHIDTRQDIH